MSRTRRIYNRIVKKAHRYYVGIDSFIKSIHEYGLAYHPYRVLCMGHCNFCRGSKLDQKYQRKIRKREFMRALNEEP